jgi:hypothetical protein
MKKTILTLLVAIPSVIYGQFGLEIGASAFNSDLGFGSQHSETFTGFYGQANLKLNSLILSASTDVNLYEEGSSATAVVSFKLGLQSNIELGETISLSPGVKFGSYGIGYDGGASEGHLGMAPGIDFVWMFTKSIGLNLGVDYNILFDGQLEGYDVEGFNYIESSIGVKLYFGDPKTSE